MIEREVERLRAERSGVREAVMANGVERALGELVRREVDAALRRYGIGSEQAAEPARSAHVGIPLSETPDLVQCPSCGYEFRPSESGSSTTIEGESSRYGTSHAKGSAERSGSSRSRSIASQSTTEGTTETETGTESVAGTSYLE